MKHNPDCILHCISAILHSRQQQKVDVPEDVESREREHVGEIEIDREQEKCG